MKPGKERAQRAVAADFGRVLHECVGKFLAAVESGDRHALETWRRDLEALFDALFVAAYTLDPLAAPDAHALRRKLHAVIGPAMNLGELAQAVGHEKRAAAAGAARAA